MTFSDGLAAGESLLPSPHQGRTPSLQHLAVGAVSMAILLRGAGLPRSLQRQSVTLDLDLESGRIGRQSETKRSFAGTGCLCVKQ